MDSIQIKEALRACYLSASLSVSGASLSDKLFVDFTNQRFEEYYNINKDRILLSLKSNLPGAKIFVHAVTPFKRTDLEHMPGETLMFSNYDGWEGTILGIAKNGDYDAYRVRISNNGVHFITTTINVDDIKPLSDKKYYGEE